MQEPVGRWPRWALGPAPMGSNQSWRPGGKPGGGGQPLDIVTAIGSQTPLAGPRTLSQGATLRCWLRAFRPGTPGLVRGSPEVTAVGGKSVSPTACPTPGPACARPPSALGCPGQVSCVLGTTSCFRRWPCPTAPGGGDGGVSLPPAGPPAFTVSPGPAVPEEAPWCRKLRSPGQCGSPCGNGAFFVFFSTEKLVFL